MKIRSDYKIISDVIETDSKVLDLGCGDGELLEFLVNKKNIKAQGIELKNESIYKCVEKGLNVYHDDIESGLVDFPDKCFDYVILNQSMQEVKKVDYVINQALRIGHKVIVGFPNFAYIKSRTWLFFKGHAPITPELPYRWYNTPNLHFLGISDFKEFCKDKNIKILNAFFLNHKQKMVKLFPNLFGANAVFVIQNKGINK